MLINPVVVVSQLLSAFGLVAQAAVVGAAGYSAVKAPFKTQRSRQQKLALAGLERKLQH